MFKVLDFYFLEYWNYEEIHSKLSMCNCKFFEMNLKLENEFFGINFKQLFYVLLFDKNFGKELKWFLLDNIYFNFVSSVWNWLWFRTKNNTILFRTKENKTKFWMKKNQIGKRWKVSTKTESYRKFPLSRMHQRMKYKQFEKCLMIEMTKIPF